MTRCHFIVPWRSDSDRERAWEWVHEQYAKHLHSVEVHQEVLQSGPWVKAIPVWRALQEITDPFAVVAVVDADVWTPGLEGALQAVEHGGWAWAMPHNRVYRLSQDATGAVLAGGSPGADLTQRPYRGYKGGGIVVSRVGVLRHIPMDPRFIGWGQEDESWGRALTTLLGEPWRGRARLYHLWHPESERQSRKRGSDVSWELYRRYCYASRSRAQMESLIGEARAACAALEHPMRHLPEVHQ